MGTKSERIIQKERDSLNRADRFYNRQVKDHLTPVMQSFIAVSYTHLTLPTTPYE